MRRLLIVRHGESIWNQDSKFTGWTNIPLTKKGEQEAENIGKLIKQNNWKPSIIFSSSLQRAIKTGSIIKKQIYNYDIPMLTTWRLNEKHYGNLEGVEREYIRNKYGKKYTKKMRTNFFMLPPLLNDIPQYINGEYPIYRNKYYETISQGESKKKVYERLIPYYERYIVPSILKGDSPLIVSHKHTVRVLMKYVKNINNDDFEKYNISSNKLITLVFDKDMKLICENDYRY